MCVILIFFLIVLWIFSSLDVMIFYFVVVYKVMRIMIIVMMVMISRGGIYIGGI